MAFRDLTLRRKLIAIGVAATAAALFLTTTVFLVTSYLVARNSVRSDIATQTAIVADNSTAALAFGDQGAATETLRALRVKDNIDVACLYDINGDVFAFFSAASDPSCPATPPPIGEEVMNSAVTESQPILVGGRQVGTIYLRGNMDEVILRMRIQATAAILAVVLSLLAAIVIASRLERVIMSPLRSLADTASRISHGSDYSLRAQKHADDEIGQLVDSFNGMVEQVERRDRRL